MEFRRRARDRGMRRCSTRTECDPWVTAAHAPDLSPRNNHRLSQSRTREFLKPHRLAEQIALDQVETHLVRRDKIGAGLDSLRNAPAAVPLGGLHAATCNPPF